MKTFSRIALAALGILAASATVQAEHLVILHTNDTHSQIDPAADDLGGVARRKVVVDSVRNVRDNVLLIDAGDIVQGSLYFNLYKGETEEKMMNALGYDMRILGNHEFDNGIERLAENLKNADAEMLASNYGMRGTPLEGRFKPYTLRRYGDKLVAFMPVNIDPNGLISKPNYPGIVYTDVFDAANNLAWYLKHILQADAVVAITHIGYDERTDISDLELVKSSRDIDVVIGGHSHTLIDPSNPASPSSIVKNADGRDVLVTQTGKFGKYVGEIDIDLDNLGKTPDYRLIRIDSRLDDRLDPAVTGIIDQYRDAVDALNSKYIAKSARALPKESEGLLNFVADFVYGRGRQLAGDVDLSIINQGGIRNDLPKGKISEGQVITLMPFFNRVEVIEIPGDSLIKAFDIMPLTGVRGVSENVEAVYDPATGKCQKVTISGKPIDPSRTYRIATIDYLAEGGDYMKPLVGHKNVATSDNIMFDDLIEYFTNGAGKGKTLNPADKPRMKPSK